MKKLMLYAFISIMILSFASAATVDVAITDPQDGDSTCEEEVCVYGTSTAVGGGGELDVVFVMDTSGSMSWNDPSNYRLTGAKALIDVLPEGAQVAIAVEDFDSNAFIVGGGFTSDHAVAKARIDTLGASGGTSIGVAVSTANNFLIANGRSGAAWVEILFTDGDGSGGEAEAVVAAANGIVIHTMGLGAGVNVAKLTTIAATTGGTYTFVSDPANLPNVFPGLSLTNIVGVTVNGNVATLYPNGNFEYCWLPLSIGPNPIIAVATATDASTGFDEIEVTRLADCVSHGGGGEIPEFTTIGAGLALLGAGFLVLRKKRN